MSALERWPDGIGGKARWSIDGEGDVQRLLFFLFRATFASTVYEDPQPKDGVRSTRPDFGIRDLRLAIEAKYIRRADQFAAVQQEVESDAAGFFPGSGGTTSSLSSSTTLRGQQIGTWLFNLG